MPEAEQGLAIRFPGRNGKACDQDEEWCEVRLDGETRRIRFHDYNEIYAIPGLYEELFYEQLKCDSPREVCGLLGEVLAERGTPAESLRVLEVGAGNGMVGECLRDLGVSYITGVDIIPEAAQAAERDRPDVYDDYRVVDLTDMPSGVAGQLAEAEFNCLVTVAALGFGDIPPEAFQAAYDLVEDRSWIAFNIKDDFLSGGDGSGFSELISRGVDSGALDLQSSRRYVHRLSVAGEPLHYVAVVAEKRGPLEL